MGRYESNRMLTVPAQPGRGTTLSCSGSSVSRMVQRTDRCLLALACMPLPSRSRLSSEVLLSRFQPSPVRAAWLLRPGRGAKLVLGQDYLL